MIYGFDISLAHIILSFCQNWIKWHAIVDYTFVIHVCPTLSAQLHNMVWLSPKCMRWGQRSCSGGTFCFLSKTHRQSMCIDKMNIRRGVALLCVAQIHAVQCECKHLYIKFIEGWNSFSCQLNVWLPSQAINGTGRNLSVQKFMSCAFRMHNNFHDRNQQSEWWW